MSKTPKKKGYPFYVDVATYERLVKEYGTNGLLINDPEIIEMKVKKKRPFIDGTPAPYDAVEIRDKDHGNAKMLLKANAYKIAGAFALATMFAGPIIYDNLKDYIHNLKDYLGLDWVKPELYHTTTFSGHQTIENLHGSTSQAGAHLQGNINGQTTHVDLSNLHATTSGGHATGTITVTETHMYDNGPLTVVKQTASDYIIPAGDLTYDPSGKLVVTTEDTRFDIGGNFNFSLGRAEGDISGRATTITDLTNVLWAAWYGVGLIATGVAVGKSVAKYIPGTPSYKRNEEKARKIDRAYEITDLIENMPDEGGLSDKDVKKIAKELKKSVTKDEKKYWSGKIRKLKEVIVKNATKPAVYISNIVSSRVSAKAGKSSEVGFEDDEDWRSLIDTPAPRYIKEETSVPQESKLPVRKKKIPIKPGQK